jgi:glycine/serine hydroxymethyltransferase
MAQIDNLQRINIEDFQEDHQDTVSRIAEYYNYFAEQVTDTINGQIDDSNQTLETVEISVTVGDNGVPTGDNRFAATSGMRGSNIIRALNSTNSTTYPTGAPFMTYEEISNGLYEIKHIAGLVSGNKFQLLIRLYP